MKKIDETELTTLALAELPPGKAAQLLRENPEAAAEVATLRELSARLETAYSQESEDHLSETQREEVLAGAVVARTSPGWKKPAIIVGLGLAAMLAVALLLSKSDIEHATGNTNLALNATGAKPVALESPAKTELPLAEEIALKAALASHTPSREGSQALDLNSSSLPLLASSGPSSGSVPTLPSVPPVDGPLADTAGEPGQLLAEAKPEELYLRSEISNKRIARDKTNTDRTLLAGYDGSPQAQVSSAPASALAGESRQSLAKFGSGGVFGGGSLGPSGFNTEAYDSISENDFHSVSEEPLSTFSIDVDTASYSNVRRFLTEGQLPPKGAVRIEELLNYFTYDYPEPKEGEPFSVNLEVATCPWAAEHRLLRVGLKTRELARKNRPPSNLVFLIDVSGSMQSEDKLPLLKQSMKLLVDQMREQDRVAIAVYAGASGLALPSTSGAEKARIAAAIDALESGGSTNGAAGIELAYQQAAAHFIEEGVNRVILASDGDFNVGVTSRSELVDLIQAKAKSGVFLSVLGFGRGNLKDSQMEELADKGNGNYAYIDSLKEGRKTLVEQASGTLVTVAKDVKIQIEFNPAQVSGYRLVGYENRVLAKEDFNNDKKDAGEVGAGHAVTALYEIVLSGNTVLASPVDNLKYQLPPRPEIGLSLSSGEMLTLKLRYKEPDGDTSKLLQYPLTDAGRDWAGSSRDFRWAAAVAQFGMLLRDSDHKGTATWGSTNELAIEGKGEDPGGYRAEFLELAKKAAALQPRE